MRRLSPPFGRRARLRRGATGLWLLVLLGTTSAWVAGAMWLPESGDAPLAVAPAQRAVAPRTARPGTAPLTAEPARSRPAAPVVRRPALPVCRRLPGRLTRPAGFYFADRTVPGEVVLTFDDGPLHGKTRRLLRILRARRVRATFFVVGKMIDRHSYRVVQEIVADGHILGSHTYHHDLAMARDPRAEARILAEFQLNQAMVDIAMLAESPRHFDRLRRRLLGRGTPVRFRSELVDRWPDIRRRWQAIVGEYGDASPYPMVYARPPGGNPFGPAFSAAARRAYGRALRRLHLINVLWRSGTANDFRWLRRVDRRNPHRIARSILFAARQGGILLIHDQIPPAGLKAGLDDLRRHPHLRVISLHRVTRRKFGGIPSPRYRLF